MGLGWHVALDKPIPGLKAPAADGKALIHRQHDLDEIAGRLGCEPLTRFVSVNPAALSRYLQEQGLDPDNFPIPDEEWFEAAEGLKTVRGLLAHIKSRPDAVLDAGRIVRDLQAIEQILAVAEQAQVLFHLTSDMPSLG